MKQVGIISDTHGYLPNAVFEHFKDCDEIWHAGDVGSIEIIEQLQAFKPLRVVWGNIDGQAIKHLSSEHLFWQCEEINVLMMHIGGYPPKYNSKSKALLRQYQPQLFICGHSHILKIMFDDALQCLHINPGAAGKQGWHKVKTLVKLQINGNKFSDCKVIELQ